MKQCPIFTHAAMMSIGQETQLKWGTDCIGDKCAWWVDAFQPGTDASGQPYTLHQHHCGMGGRVWGWDDREEA